MPNVFTPRFTSEGIAGNPMWSYPGNPYPPMPNCTEYAYGRYWEVTGQNPIGLGAGQNAGLWDDYSVAFPRGQVPVLGAVACWYNPEGREPGHVAVVEQILADGNIVTSNSYYNGRYFALETNLKDDIIPGQYLVPWMVNYRHYRLRGFIYPTNIAPSTYNWVYRVSDQASQIKLTQPEMENNAVIIYSQLTYAGWSLSAISGFLGCISLESSFNPGSCEIGLGIPVAGSDYYAGGLGLAGWTDYPPYTATYPHPCLWNANRLDVDWYDGDFQVEMLKHSTDPLWTQLGTGASRWGWNTAIAMPDKLDWDDYINNTFEPERSAYNWFYQYQLGFYPDSTGTLPTRQANARYWYDWLSGVSPLPPTDPTEPTGKGIHKMPLWMKLKPNRYRRRIF